MAAQAMLMYPDFFKVGVAASGDHDCRLYGSFWGEKYEGYPVTDQYLEQVTALKALLKPPVFQAIQKDVTPAFGAAL